jgi:hypothetical protein
MTEWRKMRLADDGRVAGSSSGARGRTTRCDDLVESAFLYRCEMSQVMFLTRANFSFCRNITHRHHGIFDGNRLPTADCQFQAERLPSTHSLNCLYKESIGWYFIEFIGYQI